VHIYPNPALPDDETIHIRYTLGTEIEPASGVEISIYNLAGELVRSVDGTVYENSENVVTIPAGNLASGVYLCTLRARSGGRTDSHLEKFAVIR
jgi:hypothetical protein